MKRPATGRSTPPVDGATALKAVPDEPEDAVGTVDDTATTDSVETAETPDAVETAEPVAVEDTTDEDETDHVVDLTAVKENDTEQDVDEVESVEVEAVADAPEEVVAEAGTDDVTEDDADAYEPPAVPPIDARVLLQAILTPPQGIEQHGLTDPLTGSVPTWRLDEEPIYLETVRDLGVPAVPEAEGGAGDVIVGEIVTEGSVAEGTPEEAVSP